MKEEGRERLHKGPGSPGRRWLALAVLAGVVASWLPVVASACPVCYGEAEGGVIDGARMAIVFMAVLVYALIGGGIALVFALRRRAQRLQEESDPRRGLRLVHVEEA